MNNIFVLGQLSSPDYTEEFFSLVTENQDWYFLLFLIIKNDFSIILVSLSELFSNDLQSSGL